jgi:hypothetical protein
MDHVPYQMGTIDGRGQLCKAVEKPSDPAFVLLVAHGKSKCLVGWNPDIGERIALTLYWHGIGQVT